MVDTFIRRPILASVCSLVLILAGIVGLKLAITRLEGKAKMSQNREARDRAGVVAGLSERAEGQDAATAALVAKLMV